MVCVYVYVHLSIHTPQYQHTKPPTTTTPIQAWCQFYHQGATDCAAIKDAAVAQADLWIRWSLVGAGMLGVFNLFSLLVSMYLCVSRAGLCLCRVVVGVGG